MSFEGFDELSHQVIGLCIEVHKHLGPGLLESIYQECLAYELRAHGIQFQKEMEIPVIYKGQDLKMNYRIDL
jgi:GxxExxY protein